MAFRIKLVGFPNRPDSHLTIGVNSESPVSVSVVKHDTEILDEPIFFSPNRMLAKQLIFRNPDGLVALVKPIESATCEYARVISPAGVQWVYGLGNDGNFYLEQFDSGVPYDRRVTFPVMHKGQRLWVGDPRQKPPTGGL